MSLLDEKLIVAEDVCDEATWNTIDLGLHNRNVAGNRHGAGWLNFVAKEDNTALTVSFKTSDKEDDTRAEDVFGSISITDAKAGEAFILRLPKHGLKKYVMLGDLSGQAGKCIAYLGVPPAVGVVASYTGAAEPEEEKTVDEKVAKPASSTDTYLGKKGTDLMSEDTKILEDGSVVGTLKYVEGFTEFDANTPDNQSGNYFYFNLGSNWTGKTITCQRTKPTQGTAKTSTDLNWILKVSSTDTEFKFTADGVTPLTLNFKKTTLQAKG